MNWPGRRREEGGSEHIAHIRVIQVLPVADNWIDEDDQYQCSGGTFIDNDCVNVCFTCEAV